MFSTDTRCAWEYNVAYIAVSSQHKRCILPNHKALACKSAGGTLEAIAGIIRIRSSRGRLLNHRLLNIWLWFHWRLYCIGLTWTFILAGNNHDDHYCRDSNDGDNRNHRQETCAGVRFSRHHILDVVLI